MKKYMSHFAYEFQHGLCYNRRYTGGQGPKLSTAREATCSQPSGVEDIIILQKCPPRDITDLYNHRSLKKPLDADTSNGSVHLRRK